MRALVSRSAGDGRVLELAEVPLPEPGPGQVRVRVRAAAVNPVDAATAAGALAAIGFHPPRDAWGLGWDLAGTVDALGPGTTGYAVGDEVIGVQHLLDVASGAHADYALLDSVQLAPAPSGVDPVSAATIPLNALTAEQALDRAGLAPGQTLLVTGAAGAVGAFAVELAVRRGLRVVALAGASDEDFVRGLGAEWFVPRGTEYLAAAVRALVPGGVDGAVDAAVLGGTTVLGAVRDRGVFVTLGAVPAVPLRGIDTGIVLVAADTERLAAVSRLAAAGGLTLRVAATYPLADAAKAYERLGAGGLRGRLVLVP